MSPTETALRARRAFVDGEFRPAVVTVVNGVIVAVADPADVSDVPDDVVDIPDDRMLLPGLVDSHVHMNDPGRSEWEGFPTATRAAAAGGVTTVVDMPLNSIPATTTPDALAVKRAAAEGRIAVDVGFWGGAVPSSLGRLAAMHDAGVVGFKCFLSPSGVDEFGHLEPAQLRAALAEVAQLGSLLIVHAEDPDLLLHDGGELGVRYADFEASRPPAAEESAIDRVIEGVRETGARAHIVHLSDADALPGIRRAKAEGLPLTVETCPHYLTLVDDEIPDGATEFKCCPPIRGAQNRDRLWGAVADGTIDAIVSDHSPSTLELKRGYGGDFGLSWGGIAGLQLGLAAVSTEVARRGIPLAAVLPLMTTGPAALVGFGDRGAIAPGCVGDFAEFDPAAERTVDAATLEHRNKISAYDGRTLVGAVRRTWLRGSLVFDDGAVGEPRGRMLRP